MKQKIFIKICVISHGHVIEKVTLAMGAVRSNYFLDLRFDCVKTLIIINCTSSSKQYTCDIK